MRVCSVTQLCLTLCNSMDCCPTKLLCPCNFPGKNSEAGCYFLLQRIFLTQGLNSCLHLRNISISEESPQIFARASQVVLTVKNLPASAGDLRDMGSRHGFNPWVRKILWRKKWQLTLVSLPGKFQGQRSLAGYIPRGCRESDTTEPTHTHKVPAGPLAKTPHSQGRGLEFPPWSGN